MSEKTKLTKRGKKAVGVGLAAVAVGTMYAGAKTVSAADKVTDAPTQAVPIETSPIIELAPSDFKATDNSMGIYDVQFGAGSTTTGLVRDFAVAEGRNLKNSGEQIRIDDDAKKIEEEISGDPNSGLEAGQQIAVKAEARIIDPQALQADKYIKITEAEQ